MTNQEAGSLDVFSQGETSGLTKTLKGLREIDSPISKIIYGDK